MRLPRATRGASTSKLDVRGARQGGAAVPEGRDGQAARARSRRSCIRRWSTSCCRGSAAGSRSSRSSSSRRSVLVPMPILDVHVKPQTRSMHRFDIEVEGIAQLLRRRRDGAQLARDDHRRQGAEVLRLGPARRPPHRDAQGRHRGGRQPHPGQGRQEQDGARRSSRPSSTSCTARASAARAPDRHRRRARASSASPAPGTPTRASSSARARRTPATSCKRQPRPGRRDREEDQGEARHRPEGRRARPSPPPPARARGCRVPPSRPSPPAARTAKAKPGDS